MKRKILPIALIVAALISIAGIFPSVGLYWLSSTDPTTGAGYAAPPYQLLLRTDQPSLYYKSGTTNTSWTPIGVGPSALGYGWFGNGVTGALVFDGVTTPIGAFFLCNAPEKIYCSSGVLNTFATNVTINAGVQVGLYGNTFFVNDTLTLLAGASISSSNAYDIRNGNCGTVPPASCQGGGSAIGDLVYTGIKAGGTGANGNNAAPGASGASAAAPYGFTTGTATGTVNNGNNGSVGQGGGGGGNTAVAGGSGGTVTAGTVTLGQNFSDITIAVRGRSFNNTVITGGSGGGGGKGGAAGTTALGGGGGSGGGVAAVIARRMVCNGNTIYAAGGHGGAATAGTGNAGGGGGGGGGVVIQVIGTGTPCLTNVTGGVGGVGVGTGGTGGTGGNGLTYTHIVGVQ